MPQIETKELTVLKGQVTRLGNEADAVVIETREDYERAADLIARLKDTGSTLKNKKESITKPLNQALREVRDLFAPLEQAFEYAESILKGKVLAFKRKADEEARKKEEAIAKKVEEGKLKLPTAEKKLDQIERVDATTRGKIGEIQIRQIKKVKIVNLGLIPMPYLIPDMVAIRRDALSGKIIPGVEVYTEETVASGSL